jgi:hypothetical protein
MPIFIDPKKVASLASVARKGKQDLEVAPEVHENNEMTMAAEDVLRAVEKKSVSDLTEALKAFFYCIEEEEGEDE